MVPKNLLAVKNVAARQHGVGFIDRRMRSGRFSSLIYSQESFSVIYRARRRLGAGMLGPQRETAGGRSAES